MRKQTLILTAWLALPFICLTLIMAWIFISLDKDRLMNEPPVGAGAGDTGNANALGQLLAGRDPDEISNANDARRKGAAVDCFNWPGGTLLTFEHTPYPELSEITLEAQIVLISQGDITILVRHPEQLEGNKWGIQLDQFETTIDKAQIAVGYRTDSSDSTDWNQTTIPLTVVAGDTLSSDPIEIPLRIGIVLP